MFKNFSIRKAAVAGQFYPGIASMLKQAIFGYLEKAKIESGSGILKAVIVPHAGYIYSATTAAYAYKLLKNLDQTKVWKILLIGPSHFVPFYGASVSDKVKWETPLGVVEAKDIRKEIGDTDNISEIAGADTQEHSLEVQVPFLQTVLKNFVLYPLVIGSSKADILAQDLVEFCKQDDVIVVVSSDLSHYLPYLDAKKTDTETLNSVAEMDIDKMIEVGDACGRTGILTLMFIAEKLGWKPKLLDYRNSGDTAGDKSAVVGYGAFAFYK